jgi:hypothetical protein
MKKVIGFLIFIVFITGCSSDDKPNEVVIGKWSTESFEVQVYAEQASIRSGQAGNWPVEQYLENRLFIHDKQGEIKSVNKPTVNFKGGTSYLYSNENKIIKLADFWNYEFSGATYDFSVDKEIHYTYIENSEVLSETTYFYR